MTTYRVSISGISASYVETWEADSAQEAEQNARQRWQHVFRDAGAFRFYATERRDRRDEEEED